MWRWTSSAWTRIYLNAYVPILQTSSQVVAFLSGHLGFPFPSPALFRQMGDRFRKAVLSFADANDIPWVRFEKDQAKLEVMQPHLIRQAVDRAVRGGGDRRGPGVPAGVDRLRGQDLHRDAAVVLLQGRPAGDLLLLLSLGRRFRPGYVKFCGYFPYTGQIYLFSELFQDHEGRRGAAVMSAAGRGW